MKQGRLIPQILERLVTDFVGARELERLGVRLPSRNDSVAVRAQGSRDDLWHPDSRMCRHQGRQGFVLDLLQTSVRDASRRIAVGERAPAAGQALSVLCIATEHAYLQRPAARVVSNVLCCADSLLR